MTRRCVVLGDVMMDISAVIDADIAYASDTPARVAFLPGGVGANTSAWMAVRGDPVTLVGAVGADAFGREIRQRLTSIGVDAHLTESEDPTGACVIIVDRRRERTMFPDVGANSAVSGDDVLAQVGADDHLHVSGYTLVNPAPRQVALAALDHARSVGATCSLDPASAEPILSHRELFDSVVPPGDVRRAQQLEAAARTRRGAPPPAREMLSDRTPCVVVKVGARGAMALDASGFVEAPSPATEILDTTGAGDAFTAGFLPAWLRGDGLARALASGQEVAALAVARVGASPLDP